MKRIIVEFLCRHQDKGFSSKEISQALSLSEEEINFAMLKLGLSDLLLEFTKGFARRSSDLSGGKTRLKIEDVTVQGITYYRCRRVD